MKVVLSAFFPKEDSIEFEPFGNGHIQDTYKVTLTEKGESYILQKLNINVFKKPEVLINNHQKLLEADEFKGGGDILIPALIPTADGSSLYYDAENAPWRMQEFVPDSYALELMEDPSQAQEAGMAYGWFAACTSNLDSSEYEEAIPLFHNLPSRLGQLEDAIANDAAGRMEKTSSLVQFFLDRKEMLLGIQALVDDGTIPTRVVHNDTKINNVLFRDKKVVAVIDLDTVGPGIIFYDYGDSLRTTANTADEDEQDLSKVSFNLEAFEAFTKGYLSMTKDILVKEEKTYLHVAPILMTFIMGIRFLTDYLNGDTYYKIKHPEHNMDRTLVQQHLIMDIEAKSSELKEIISNSLA